VNKRFAKPRAEAEFTSTNGEQHRGWLLKQTRSALGLSQMRAALSSMIEKPVTQTAVHTHLQCLDFVMYLQGRSTLAARPVSVHATFVMTEFECGRKTSLPGSIRCNSLPVGRLRSKLSIVCPASPHVGNIDLRLAPLDSCWEQPLYQLTVLSHLGVSLREIDGRCPE